MKLLLPIIIVIILVGGGYLLANPLKQKTSITPTPTPISGSQELKTFQSKLMEFSVDLPNKFSAEEKFGSVAISSPEGQIYIDKNGTNFDNLDDYLNDLSKKNNFELTDKKILLINNLPTVTGVIDGETLYFIYVPNRVYSISTSSQPLYSNLDQIAQSFRYIP